MKKLVLIICFLELVFATVRTFNEKMAPIFVHMQRPKSSNLISLQQAGQNEKIKRILHLMQLVDPNCLRKFHNEFRYNRRPFGMLRPLRMPAFRNDDINQLDQVSYYNKMRKNQLKEPQNRRYFVNDRIIFVPPYAKLAENPRNESQNKNTLSDSLPNTSVINHPPEKSKNMKETPKEILVSDTFRPKEQNRKYTQMYRKFKDQPLRENFTALQNIQKTIGSRKGPPSRFLQRVINPSSSTATYSDIPSRYFWPQARPTKIQPYEVEEIIEEELSVNVNDEKNDLFKNLQFGEPSLSSRTKDMKKMNNSEDREKMNAFHDVIDSSINSVLKTLMTPMKTIPSSENSREFFSKEQFENRPPHRGHFIDVPFQNKTFSNNNFLNYHGTTHDKRPSNRPEKSKQLKILSAQIDEKPFSWEQKPSESTSISELKYKGNLNLKSTWRVEYQNNVHPDNTTPIPIGVNVEKSISHLNENLRQSKTTITEAEPKVNDESFINTFKTQMPSLNNFTVQQMSVKPTKYPYSASELPSILIEVSPNVKELTTLKLTTTNSAEKWTDISTEEIKTLISTQNLKTEEPSSVITINEAELSTRNFQEFTDHPMTFNLLTTVKSDLKKNSRKMHFGQEPSETTFNDIAEVESTGPRRSDILITENFDDYVDVDNNLSTLNYLDKLKQSNFSLDSSSESVIPLIPAVITDLREGKIVPEDISVLSEAFSKYWSAITALSNITNLDMLPLLKMKNEEDLKKVLEIFFPQNTEMTTIKVTETETETATTREGNEYDYIDEYNDFYQYVLGSEQEEKEKKRKKLRPKRNRDESKVIQSHFEVF